MTFRPLNEFIVKVSSRCNLNCNYCYEYNLGDHTWKTQPKTMSEQTARALGRRIAEHAARHALPSVFVSLHGGEVLLLGPKKLDAICGILFEEVAPFAEVQLSMQTNATLLNEHFIEVIRRRQIAVSVSVDGAKAAHDRHRTDHRGRGSFDRVARGIELLSRSVPESFTGLLAVIDVANDPIVTFDAIASHGVEFVDFLLPHHNWDSPPPRPNGDPIAYGQWYWELYKAWTSDRYPDIQVRFLANIVSQLAGGTSIFEEMTLAPATLITVATDGSLEAVDSIKSTASGIQQIGLNIDKDSFDAALEDPLISIRQAGEAQLCSECRACAFKNECAGGYFPHRWGRGGGFNNPSVYCTDLFWLVSQIRDDLAARRRKREALLHRTAH
ncbi:MULTISPECIES: FxsB family cyclophane-forming radical SAM/SPASM peptide maturase [unclassified Mesorhizobium]|uniref:FxsB family cyclophane-forming radical SAM/SPASM peptide maturase n=1 Tax=unclassified Mesorhizobium TaxID=325217 RepID=UPI0003CEB035|nr:MULTISPECIES: FxsB family cyclophane-forming radical SAM/SPASM peptide maturase [unclassified Mesorhizobium]ESY55400.1 radical SAM protein [Mesorhizobium sp. LNJC374B00]ESY56975.1 radical SAM protein [Mesorhizobium sp. LNJC372A00]WJI79377.1 FxsB family radical SAM/SPASM domain protein [Mesorhizobium sp. C374B]WJI85913.1 FxsB family radical SAM/SPASM domain protein [Mesorhizobium sp. C372A]